jgi:hypothetical protein
MSVRSAAIEQPGGGLSSRLRAELKRFPPWDVVLLQAAVFGFCNTPPVTRFCDHWPWLYDKDSGGLLLWGNLAGILVSTGYFLARAEAAAYNHDRSGLKFQRLAQEPEIVILGRC